MPLSSILDKIIADARREADEIDRHGKDEAARIRAEAEEEAAYTRHNLIRQGEERVRAQIEKRLSARRLQLGRDLLAARRECLDAVFDGLKERLVPEAPDLYARRLAALVGEHVTADGALLQVGQSDIERFGKSFPGKVLQALRDVFPGWEVGLSPEPAFFGSGLVLRQKGVVHNLSLESLIAEARQEMEGVVAKALFEA